MDIHTRDDERTALALARALVTGQGADYFRLWPKHSEATEALASAAVNLLAALARDPRLRGAEEELDTLTAVTLQLDAESEPQ